MRAGAINEYNFCDKPTDIEQRDEDRETPARGRVRFVKVYGECECVCECVRVYGAGE